MARFDPNIYQSGTAAITGSHQGIADAFTRIAEQQRKQDLLNQEKLRKDKEAAQKQANNPAYILAQVRQGLPVTPEQQAILDIASAKSERASFDPVTGQLVQTGGFPGYGQQPAPVAEAGMLPPPEVSRAPAEADVQQMMAQANTPRERAEMRKMLMQEQFTKRKEERKAEKGKEKSIKTSKSLIRTLDKLIKDPELGDITGPIQGEYSQAAPAFMKSRAQRRLQPIINQLKGQQFGQAFETLKGGGQITEVEGLKAEQAQAALDQTMDDSDYKAALEDYKKVVENGLARAEGRKPPNDFGEEFGEVSTQAEYDELPSGAFYLENGVKYRKP